MRPPTLGLRSVRPEQGLAVNVGPLMGEAANRTQADHQVIDTPPLADRFKINPSTDTESLGLNVYNSMN